MAVDSWAGLQAVDNRRGVSITLVREAFKTSAYGCAMIRVSTICLLGLLNTISEASESRPLFSFRAPDSAQQWVCVNDGVMGGRSDGRFIMDDLGFLRFYGRLSLANNGGFASIRSRNRQISLREGDTLILKVRGDGRQYNLNLYPQRRRMAFSYRASFATKQGEWTEVRIPLNDFAATSFGRVVRGAVLRPDQISGLGISLSDKKPGFFRLDVKDVRVQNEEPRVVARPEK